MDKIMNGGWTNRDSYNKMVSVNKVNNGEKAISDFYNELYNNFGGKQVEGTDVDTPEDLKNAVEGALAVLTDNYKSQLIDINNSFVGRKNTNNPYSPLKIEYTPTAPVLAPLPTPETASVLDGIGNMFGAPADSETKTNLDAELITINLYSYLDEIKQPNVKMEIKKSDDAIKVTPEQMNVLLSINKKDFKSTVPEIVGTIGSGSLFSNYFNRDPNEGAKTITQKIMQTSDTTVENAINGLIKIRTDANKVILDPFILYLRGQNQKVILKNISDFNGENVYTKYNTLIGKTASQSEIDKKYEETIKESLNNLLVKLTASSTEKGQVTAAVEQIKAIEGLNKINFNLTDSKGGINENNLKGYISNIDKLKATIDVSGRGLIIKQNVITRKYDNMTGQQIISAITSLPISSSVSSFFGRKGGRRTRKHKKSKTQKRGRRNKKTRRH